MNVKDIPNEELKNWINKLKKKGVLDYFGIPEEYRSNPQIVKLQREQGIRKSDKKGYDIMSDRFFVDEKVVSFNFLGEQIEKEVSLTFDSFEQYFDFLNGDIYENACYFQFYFTDEIITKYSIDESKLNKTSLIKETIDDYLNDEFIIQDLDNALLEEEEKKKEKVNRFQRIRKDKELQRKWLDKYLKCETSAELAAVNDRHEKSKEDTDALFFFWKYIHYHGEKAFEPIMEFVSTGKYPAYFLEHALCFVYNPEKVLEKYNYTNGSKSTISKYKSKMKNLVKKIMSIGGTDKIPAQITGFFDSSTSGYRFENNIKSYCVKTVYQVDEFEIPLYEYFDKFEDFVARLGNNLSCCDLANALDLDITPEFCKKYNYSKSERLLFEEEKIDSINKAKSYIVSLKDNEILKQIEKYYNPFAQCFCVQLSLYDEVGKALWEKSFTFKYFFDFLFFLNKDLSEANLIFCEGLINLRDFSEFNFENSKLRSLVWTKLGRQCEKQSFLKQDPSNFEVIVKNEEESHDVLLTDWSSTSDSFEDGRKIHYITDLHLIHRLQNAGCVTREDCIYTMQRIINGFDLNNCGLLLIGGDVSSNYSIFCKFVEMLSCSITRQCKVVFTLGNHELWAFPDKSLEEIVQIYRGFLEEHGMKLLHNELLYANGDFSEWNIIPDTDIFMYSYQEIRELLKTARVHIFGGLGFSGYNEEVNANIGVYKKVVNRDKEILETQKFEALYDRILYVLNDKEVVIFTHMPFEDWHMEPERGKNFIYVSGHNHRNTFFEDGEIRIYSDNQIGYHCETPRLKYFRVDGKYDWFLNYPDGIHKITRDDYIEFYRGKNICITFNRDIHELFMLKKNGYYCFILKNALGNLFILNGGAIKSLTRSNLNYYYTNMDAQIAYIKTPLDKFWAIQKSISNDIKKIGGSGYIHGTIVDIDYYNHIYINPIDLKMTPYYALDMIRKYAYPNIPALLSQECPELYVNYKKLLEAENRNEIAIKSDFDETQKIKPILYENTDIYQASREIRKMQKLRSQILTTWYDNVPGVALLPDNHYKPISKPRMMNCGMNASIIDMQSSYDVTVEFEDGTVVEHTTRSKFMKGNIDNPNLK